MKRTVVLFAALVAAAALPAAEPHGETSVAGFFPLAGSGRRVWDFNQGWRFHLGEAEGAGAAAYDDAAWEVVHTPHTVRLVPAEASGGRNYQGCAWYRKHFTLPAETAGRDVTLHFEAVMGRQQFFVNGRLVKEHLGGYLPVTLSLTEAGVQPGEACVVAVRADNSDDPRYPPGKPQYTLDFAYHGGIYRDVWLIAKSKVAVTDAVEAGKPAGGGVFVHFDRISAERAEIYIDTEVGNRDRQARSVAVETTLTDAGGRTVASAASRIVVPAGGDRTARQQLVLRHPQLWSPDSPTLYRVETRIREGRQVVDGGVTRIGIRRAEFDPARGFVLNGEPFGKLVGANRHQDFAYVGNALPNSQQWRDAKRLRDAGCRIIRTAHYPQDPAFMDACDELGLFVIVATPGWQFWNEAPEFAQRVHENTRSIIRRDRNHPSVLLWEPILNETPFPEEFALEALRITREEYPYAGRPAAAADEHSAGVRAHYDVVYGWPGDEAKADAPRQCIFTREFGERVDDWYAQNNDNRASRSWGEHPMTVQALSLAETYDGLYRTGPQFVGGAQWHPFDHQRGYHPDPYWGGIFDAFRQPKYAYWMFRSQTDADLAHPLAESGPMVKIAHEMTSFSARDVLVFSNCDSVRLTIYGEKSWTKPVVRRADGMPHPPLRFEGVWDFWEARSYSYTRKNWQQVELVAEGFVGGEVVCTERKMPARRSTRLRLSVDWQQRPLVADGSDFVVVIAEVTDDNGHVRRLAKEQILFGIEGEGELIGDSRIGANPRTVEWGSAPVLVRSTLRAGKIRVTARVLHPGIHAPEPAEIEFESVASPLPMCCLEQAAPAGRSATAAPTDASPLTDTEKRALLDEVDRQQQAFGIR